MTSPIAPYSNRSPIDERLGTVLMEQRVNRDASLLQLQLLAQKPGRPPALAVIHTSSAGLRRFVVLGPFAAAAALDAVRQWEAIVAAHDAGRTPREQPERSCPFPPRGCPENER